MTGRTGELCSVEDAKDKNGPAFPRTSQPPHQTGNAQVPRFLSGGTEGGSDFPSSVYLWKKRGTNQSRNTLNESILYCDYSRSMGAILGILRMFIGVLQWGNSRNPLQQAQWEKKCYFSFWHCKDAALKRRYWTRANIFFRVSMDEPICLCLW